MGKIKTKAEADEYYRIINSEIDKYVNWKISPDNLKKYFSRKDKMKNFLVRVGLDGIERIETIVNDVIEDREAGYKENILKFESFFLNESIKFKDVDVEYEKVLADLFHTSLSSVELSDKQSHRFTVSDFDNKKDVAIFSQDDVMFFKKEVLKQLVKETKESEIDLFQTDLGLDSGKPIKTRLKLNLSDILDENKLESRLSSLLDDNSVIKILGEWLNDYPVLKTGFRFSYFKKYNDFHIWMLEERSNIKRN